MSSGGTYEEHGLDVHRDDSGTMRLDDRELQRWGILVAAPMLVDRHKHSSWSAHYWCGSGLQARNLEYGPSYKQERISISARSA